jgi:hypothetical protein
MEMSDKVHITLGKLPLIGPQQEAGCWADPRSDYGRSGRTEAPKSGARGGGGLETKVKGTFLFANLSPKLIGRHQSLHGLRNVRPN